MLFNVPSIMVFGSRCSVKEKFPRFLHRNFSCFLGFCGDLPRDPPRTWDPPKLVSGTGYKASLIPLPFSNPLIGNDFSEAKEMGSVPKLRGSGGPLGRVEAGRC